MPAVGIGIEIEIEIGVGIGYPVIARGMGSVMSSRRQNEIVEPGSLAGYGWKLELE